MPGTLRWGADRPARLVDEAGWLGCALLAALAGLWRRGGAAAAPRERSRERAGYPVGARAVSAGCEVDAVGNEPVVLDHRGPVVDPHLRVPGAGPDQGSVPGQHVGF